MPMLEFFSGGNVWGVLGPYKSWFSRGPLVTGICTQETGSPYPLLVFLSPNQQVGFVSSMISGHRCPPSITFQKRVEAGACSDPLEL